MKEDQEERLYVVTVVQYLKLQNGRIKKKMNRKIKFRAWHPIDRKMYEVASIDFFWGLVELQWWQHNEKGVLVRRKVEESIRGQVDNSVEDDVLDPIIMQFTEVLDFEGKDIYEGDIVVNKNPWNTKIISIPKVVTFEHGGFIGLDYDIFCEYPPLVIGNIYENPELTGGIKDEQET